MVASITQSQTPANSPEEAERRRQRDQEYITQGENADYGKASEGLKEGLSLGEFNLERQAKAAKKIAQEEFQEDPELDFDAAFGDNEEFSFDLDDTSITGKTVYETVQEPSDIPLQNSPDYSFDTEEINNGTESLENNKKIAEWKYTPLLDNFVQRGLININTVGQIQSAVANSSDSIQEIIENIDTSPDIKKKIIESITYIESEQNEKKGREDLERDFGQELKDFEGENGELLGFGNDALNLLGQAYLPKQNENEDTQVLLNLAFQTAANAVIKGKQIKRTETFEKTLERAKNNNLSFKDRFLALQGLLKMTNQDQGVKGRKKRVEHERMQKKQAINKIEKEIQSLQYDIDRAQQEENQEKVKQLKQQQDALREKLSEVIQTGDLKLGGGEMDVVSEVSQENITQNS